MVENSIVSINHKSYVFESITEKQLTYHSVHEFLCADSLFQTHMEESLGDLSQRISSRQRHNDVGWVEFPLNKTEIQNYRAVCLASQTLGDVGFFLLPGITGTALGNIEELSSLQRQPNKPSLGLAASLSSSVSLDTLEEPFPKNLVERGIYQAGLIVALAQTYNCKEIVITGGSLGGLEAIYVGLAVESIMRHKGLDEKQLKLTGVILAHPAGHYSADFLKTVQRLLASGNSEIDQIFPSPQYMQQLADDLEVAKQVSDAGEVHRIGRIQQASQKKREQFYYGNVPAFINPAELAALLKIDQQLAGAIELKQKQELLKTRQETFKPILARIFEGANAELERTSLYQTYKLYLSMAQAVIPHAFQPLPDSVRRLVNFPVSFLTSKNDVVFPHKEFSQHSSRWEVAQRQYLRSTGRVQDLSKPSLYFPNAPLVIDAIASYQSHIAALTDPDTFSDKIADLIARMQQYNRGSSKQAFERRYY